MQQRSQTQACGSQFKKMLVAHSNTDSLSSSEEKGVASMGRAARKPRWSPVNITCSHKRSYVQKLAKQRVVGITLHPQAINTHDTLASACTELAKKYLSNNAAHFSLHPRTVLDASLAH